MRKLILQPPVIGMLLAFLLILGLASVTLAQETGWRCGNLFVEDGVDSLQVMANCGEPISKEKTYIDQYGEVQKWAYGPEAGYYYVLYLFAGKVVDVQSIRQE